MPIELRPYQQRGVADIRAAYAGGARSVLFALPTGGGKTFTFSYIAEGAAAKGNEVTIIVHRTELLRQASCSLAAIGLRHGIIAPDDRTRRILRAHVDRFERSWLDSGSHVRVASLQTLGRRLPSIQDRGGLIILDEAHHATAGTWRKILEAAPRARVLGVTATPTRTDGHGLGDVFDVLVQGPTIRELIDQGHLVQPKVYAPPMRFTLEGVHRRGGDFVPSELAALIDTPAVIGDAVEHYLRLARGLPAIAFCPSVKTAEDLAAEFRARGVRAACVHGEMDDDERDRLILGHGKVVDVLTSCDLISEGTDTVSAACAILLRPTESEALYLQQVGRVLRPAPGKAHALILDHVGNCLRHGMPDAHREWTLEGRKRSRGKAANDNEPALAVRQCPQCYAAHAPMPRCPACGYAYPAQAREIEQREGQLEEVDPELLEQQRRAKRVEVGKARTREDLERIAAERGYARGWVHKMMKLKGIAA